MKSQLFFLLVTHIFGVFHLYIETQIQITSSESNRRRKSERSVICMCVCVCTVQAAHFSKVFSSAILVYFTRVNRLNSTYFKHHMSTMQPRNKYLTIVVCEFIRTTIFARIREKKMRMRMYPLNSWYCVNNRFTNISDLNGKVSPTDKMYTTLLFTESICNTISFYFPSVHFTSVRIRFYQMPLHIVCLPSGFWLRKD